MGAGRQKFNFYAVTNGKEIVVYTSGTQAGDSVLGFAKAKYKGFCTFSEAAAAMVNARFSDYSVFDGQRTYKKSEYEQNKIKQTGDSEVKSVQQEAPSESEQDFQNCNVEKDFEDNDNFDTDLISTPTVYIDGSCIRNGANSAQADIGISQLTK